jgi:Protein kinase domain
MTSDRRILYDRYRLVSQLGEGGMGSVWLAKDLLLERPVALKELIQHSAAAERSERRIRALREARAMARVQHPAIVRIHDVFYHNDDPWIVMEYVKGRPLAEIIAQRSRLGEQEIARIGLPVLRGLSAAHQASVVHRDVKPANILVADDGSIFLVDFGIAKIAEDTSLTMTSSVVGTPEFLAPERLSADGPIGPPADLWSLGVTFFFALEGYSPFLRRGERARETTMLAILHDPSPRPRNGGRLASVILRLLNKDWSRRGDAKELEEDLQAIIEEQAAPGPAAPGPAASPQHVARPPVPPASSLTGPRLADACRRVKDAGADAGAAMLLKMPDDHAAQVLADYPAPLAGELIQAIAATRPRTAVTILQTLSAAAAGHAMDYLKPAAAASLLTAMTPGEAARILGRTTVRTAATVIMTVPMSLSAQWIRAMQVKRAKAALEYVKPVTVAALLRTVPDDLSALLLREFSSSFRAQVLRHL